MENVGCVTFNEAYLMKGQIVTLSRRQMLQIATLHELAHHWFGNLVTMKWWNDLWLNESFATLMAYIAMSNAPELAYFKTHWLDFFYRKSEGINQD